MLLQNIQKNDIYMSVGGDNYCYAGVEQLSDINYIINKKGAKSVLWGCSINPDVINKDVIDDLKRYSMIITRESITYQALKDKGATIVELDDATLDSFRKAMDPVYEEYSAKYGDLLDAINATLEN